MAKSSSNLFIFVGVGILAYALATRKPKVTTLSLKIEPANPKLPPPPKSESTVEKISEKQIEELETQAILLFNGQYAVRYPSQQIADDQVAPLILIIPPYRINLTSKIIYKKDAEDPLGSFPTNLNARVFFAAIPGYFGGLDEAGKEGKYLISGLKKLQELYPTNKIIVFGFGDGANIAFYLAGSNAIDSAFIFGNYGNYNYIIKNPGITKLIGWVSPNAVGDKWYNYNDGLYATYKAFESFGKANYPLPNFVTGKNEYNWTTGELYQIAQDLIKFESYIPGKSDIGWTIEWDGNLNQCAIIIKPEKLGEATWSITSSIVNAAKISGSKVTSSDFWGYVDAFINSINSKCTLQGRYYDDSPDAMFGYLAIRSAIRALMMRGLMEPKDADLALTQAKNEAKKNGVTDTYLPPLKSDFEP